MDTFIGIIAFFSILGLVGLFTVLVFRFCYSPLVRKFRHSNDFQGTHLYWAEVRINGLRFSNNLFCAYNADGIYLYASWPMRCFYPPVLIPWEEIAEDENKDRVNRYVIGTPKIVTLSLEISKRNMIDELPKKNEASSYAPSGTALARG
jgi:hypothetical protein